MNKRLAMMLFVTTLIVFLLPTISQTAVFLSKKSMEGTVQNISANFLTITGLDKERKEVNELLIEVNPETKFEQISNLFDLKAGDKVRVEYREDKDKRVATHIAKVGMIGQPIVTSPGGFAEKT